MKGSVIVGSLRGGSFNRKLFENYREMAAGRFEFVEADISSFPLYNYDVEVSDFPKAVEVAADIIRSSDCLFIFSPEYNYSIPGVLKNAIDWLSRVEHLPFKEKPTAIIGGSTGRFGTARMQYQLRQVGVTMDMRILNRPEIMVTHVKEAFDDAGVLTDAFTRKMLEKHINSFSDFVKKYHER